MSVVESLHQKWEGLREEIERLPDAERCEVAQDIISDLRPYQFGRPKKPLKDLLGIAAVPGVEFTDEEIDRMIDEERMRRLGG